MYKQYQDKTKESTPAAPDIIPLEVPAELVTKGNGFSLDCGGSVIKIVYRTVKDYENAKGQNVGILNLVLFPKERVDDAVSFIQEHAHISRTGADPTPIYVTGIGGHQYQERFCTQLNVRFDVITEFDSIVRGFTFLSSKMTRKQLIHPIDMEALQAPINETKSMMKYIENNKDLSKVEMSTEASLGDIYKTNIKNESGWASNKPLAEEEDIFPCLLAILGSGAGYIKVEKDGTFGFLDGSNRAGRAMIGMASIFLECKSFEELVELVSKGDATNVHTCMYDLLESAEGSAQQDDTNVYGAAKQMENNVTYFFGKGVGKTASDFKREDLARALVGSFISDFANCAYTSATYNGCKHVFFGGSTLNAPVLRYIMANEFTRKALLGYVMTGKDPRNLLFDFLIPGPHLGAMGAMLNTVEDFIGTRKDTAAPADGKPAETDEETKEETNIATVS